MRFVCPLSFHNENFWCLLFSLPIKLLQNSLPVLYQFTCLAWLTFRREYNPTDLTLMLSSFLSPYCATWLNLQGQDTQVSREAPCLFPNLLWLHHTLEWILPRLYRSLRISLGIKTFRLPPKWHKCELKSQYWLLIPTLSPLFRFSKNRVQRLDYTFPWMHHKF